MILPPMALITVALIIWLQRSKNQDLIEDDTLLKDIYYETSIDMKIYRISFDFLR